MVSPATSIAAGRVPLAPAAPSRPSTEGPPEGPRADTGGCLDGWRGWRITPTNCWPRWRWTDKWREPRPPPKPPSGAPVHERRWEPARPQAARPPRARASQPGPGRPWRCCWWRSPRKTINSRGGGLTEPQPRRPVCLMGWKVDPECGSSRPPKAASHRPLPIAGTGHRLKAAQSEPECKNLRERYAKPGLAWRSMRCLVHDDRL